MTFSRTIGSVFLVLSVLVVFDALPAAGRQPAAGPVAGVVVDAFGDPVADVEITALSLSGYREEIVSGDDGSFGFPSLPPGSYLVTAVLAGYANAVNQVSAGTLGIRLVVMPLVPTILEITVVDRQGLVLPGALVSAVGPEGAVIEGVSVGDGVFRSPVVRPGVWALQGSMPGFSTARADLSAAFGAAARARLVLDVDLALVEEIVVLGAERPPGRRAAVRLVDSPVSTTVVSAAELAAAPGAGVANALRGVPGLNVIQLSARDIQMTTRQATSTVANSQLVLVDGRTMYLDFYGVVLWDLVPLNTESVEQIEVVRGPASVTWGPNAMTGAVHLVTRRPREMVGTTATLSGGWFDRGPGSGGPGAVYGSGVTLARAPTDSLAYRISAGYFRSDALSRVSETLERGLHPANPNFEIGGGSIPPFSNRGTSQPRFDVRVDHTLRPDREFQYSAGVAGTDGVLHSGFGPLRVDRGTYLGYGKVNYIDGALRLQAFANVFHGRAQSLLYRTPDRGCGELSTLCFDHDTVTFDVDAGHSRSLGSSHFLSYGGNIRRNGFELSHAPGAPPRTEVGAYVQDEIFLGRHRLVAGVRADHLDVLDGVVLSPRAAVVFRPGEDHGLTFSWNWAFRAPSVFESFANFRLFYPGVLTELAALRPFLGGFVPPGLPPAYRDAAVAGLEQALDRTTARDFELPLRVTGSSNLRAERLEALEAAYNGVLPFRNPCRSVGVCQPFRRPYSGSRPQFARPRRLYRFLLFG